MTPDAFGMTGLARKPGASGVLRLIGKGVFLNGLAVEAIGKPDYVVLMYDRRRSVIGVSPATSSPDTTYAFTAPRVDKNGVLVLDLNEVRSVKRM